MDHQPQRDDEPNRADALSQPRNSEGSRRARGDRGPGRDPPATSPEGGPHPGRLTSWTTCASASPRLSRGTQRCWRCSDGWTWTSPGAGPPR